MSVKETSTTRSSANPSVFVCYSRDNIAFVQQLDNGLQAHGINVNLDLRFEITPDYKQELYQKILAADTLLFVISPSSVSSPHCKDEVQYAVDHKKRILAVMHEDGYDDGLISAAVSKPEWIFMRTPHDLQERLPNLLAAIRTDFQLMQMHTRLSLRAEEWMTAVILS